MVRLTHMIGAAFLAAALFAMPAASAQTTTFPATPVGEAAKTWLDALNSPDPADIARVDPRAVGIRAQSGGFDVISIESGTDTQITALLRERLFGGYLRTTWTSNTANPPAIVGLRAAPAQPPPGAPASERMDDKALGDYINAAIKKTDYSGAILIARDGKPVFTAVNGLSDREKNLPNTLDTQFRVGSMNKMMTATAILQLVQAGKVKLDAPLGTYLKDYPNLDIRNNVTVHHLLTHTGGVGDIFGPQFTEKRLELKTLKDYVALYGTRAPQFKPGEKFQYANYGFILLGQIIEEVSGQSYPDYLRDHIFKQAGMTRSGFEPENAGVPNRAKGYMLEGAGYKSNADTLPWSGTSAGGGYSTVGDFLAFANAVTGHKLLDAKHTELLTTGKGQGGYAYGFSDMSNPEMRMVGHSGGAPGMNGDLRIIGDGKAVVVALSNVSPPGMAGAFTGEIVRRLKVAGADGKPARLGPPPPAPPATEEARMAAFKANDRDGDGRIDKAGYKAVLETLGFGDQLDTLFAQRDSNRDGFISSEEYRTPIPQ